MQAGGWEAGKEAETKKKRGRGRKGRRKGREGKQGKTMHHPCRISALSIKSVQVNCIRVGNHGRPAAGAGGGPTEAGPRPPGRPRQGSDILGW